MPYALVDDGLHGHPKVAVTSLRAIGLWTLGLSYSCRYLTDGELDEGFRATVVRPRGREARSAAAELRARGFWLPEDGVDHVHDFLDHQRSRAQIEAERRQNRERQAAFRERRNGRPAKGGVARA